jgi:hypothetical protein
MQVTSKSAVSAQPSTPRLVPAPVAARAKATNAQPQDALAQGLAAQTPEIYTTCLIRVVGGAVETFNKLQRTKDRYQAGQATKAELHSAEAAMEQTYGELLQLHDSVSGAKALKFKTAGFDLEATWRTHGLPLPNKPNDGHLAMHNTLYSVACAASLMTTFGALGALFLLPSTTMFCIAGPIALISGLGGGALVAVKGSSMMHAGGALVAVKGSSMMHAGEAPEERMRKLLDNPNTGIGAGSPEAYKDALIYLTTRTKMAQQQLAILTAKPNADPDLVRLAKQEVTDDLRTLWALKSAVGDVKAADWKLRGFDIEGAWKTYGMALPTLAALNKDAVIPKLDPTVTKAMGFMGGLLAIVFGAIGADLFNAGRLGGVAALAMRLVASLFKVHVVVAMAALGLVGYLAGGLAGNLLNKVVGTPSQPKAPTLN